MNHDLKIIPAEKKDIPLIFSFIKGLADHVDLSHEVVVTEKELNDTLFTKDSHVEVLIGYYSGEPAAFVLFFPNYSTFLGKPGLYIEDLYIKPGFRGMGIGKAIFRYLANLAIDRGYGKMDWYAAEWNESAIGFYDSLGAKPLDRRKVYRLKGEALISLSKIS